MKHTGALPLVTAAGGAAAFSLRLAQMRTGFSPETGLPVAGALHGRLLIALILAFSVLLAVLVQPLPSRRPEPRPLEEVFSAPGAAPLLYAGAALLALAGAAWDCSVLRGSVVIPGGGAARWIALLSGGVMLAAGACLLPAVSAACGGRRAGKSRVPPALFLPAPAAAVFHLVLIYRLRSSAPGLSAYAVELLAVCFAAAALCRLAGFAFDDGCVRTFAFLAGETVLFCAAALADRRSTGESAFFGGCLLLFLGLLFALRTDAGRRRGAPPEARIPR